LKGKLYSCKNALSLQYTVHTVFLWSDTILFFADCSSITTPQDAHNLEVSAAGLSWLGHFGVQCYT